MKSVFTPDIRAGFSYLAKCLLSDTESEKKAWVLIPDQMALTTERELSLLLPAKSQLYYDIVSPRRLANNIFRRFGGLHYNYADKSSEMLLLWRAAVSCRDADALLLYGNSLSDTSSVPTLMSAVNELKQSMISPEEFSAAAVRLYTEDPNSETYRKFLDLSNIYAAYDELLKESFDDRLADVSSAAKILSENDFFNGDSLYVFSFSSFTAQQYSLLKEAARQASNVTFIFTCPSEISLRSPSPEYEGIADTNRRLHSVADRLGISYETEILPSERDDEAYIVASSLWGIPQKVTDDVPRHLRLLEVNSHSLASEAAVIEISKAVRGGKRYRDIAIVSGNTENYFGILDRLLDEHSVPAHMAKPILIRSVPSVAAVLAAIRIVTGGWRREDIISYCKTGASPISDDDADELLLYLSTWNIFGRRFYDPDGGGWGMNPDGYTPDWTEEGMELLDSVNRSRSVLTEHLMPLHEALSDSTNAAEKSDAILKLLEASSQNSDPLSVGSSADAQAEDILRRALSGISLIFGDGKMKTSDFVSALSLTLDTLTVATLPSLSDEVEVTDPLRMRGAGYELVILLGVGNGVFPADISDEGFFSDSDKVIFEDHGINIGSAPHKAAMELYNFSRAAAASYGDLIVIYTPEKGNAAPDVVERIRTLYPSVTVEKYRGADDISHFYSPFMIKKRFNSVSSPALSLAMREIVSESEEGRRILEAENYPVSMKYEKISEEGANALFGGDLSLSQSRIESFIACRFGFYCRYVLSLSEKKRASVSTADVGTFVHAVLERIFRNGFLLSEESELRERVDIIIEDYVSSVIPPDEIEESKNTRLRSLFRRLRRSVLVLLDSFRKEFQNSRFVPVLFEMPIGVGALSAVPAQKIPLGDGTFAVLRGIADRVDSYRDGEGNLWVRVIDYKTGHRTFSVSDIEKGRNLQLPLYLYAISNSENRELLHRLGGEDGDVIRPAGFLYVNVSTKDEVADSIDDVAEVKKLPRSGLLLADENILRAQDPSLSGEYIPVKIKKDGSFYADSLKSTATEEDFSRLYETLTNTVIRISENMRSGDTSAVPDATEDPCKYCKMKQFCRSAKRN